MNWIDGRKELNQMKGNEHSADTEKKLPARCDQRKQFQKHNYLHGRAFRSMHVRV